MSVQLARRDARDRLSPAAFQEFAFEPLLTREDIATALASVVHPRLLVRLRKDGHVLAIPVRRGFLYPAFQLDPSRQGIDPRVAYINKSLLKEGDVWAALGWWFDPASRPAVPEVTDEIFRRLNVRASALIDPRRKVDV